MVCTDLYQPQVENYVKAGLGVSFVFGLQHLWHAEWEAELEASKQTFEEQLQSSKQVRRPVHRASSRSEMMLDI